MHHFRARRRRTRLHLVCTVVGVFALATVLYRIPTTDGAFTAATDATGVITSSACPADVVLPATEDTMVAEDQPTTAFGNATALQMTADPTRSRRILVKFAVPPITPECQPRAAIGMRHTTPTDTTGRAYTAWLVTEPWSADTVTWATMPAHPTQSWHTMTPSPDWIYASAQLTAAGDYRHGFVITDAMEAPGPFTVTVHSAETALGPQLELDYP